MSWRKLGGNIHAPKRNRAPVALKNSAADGCFGSAKDRDGLAADADGVLCFDHTRLTG